MGALLPLETRQEIAGTYLQERHFHKSVDKAINDRFADILPNIFQDQCAICESNA